MRKHKKHKNHHRNSSGGLRSAPAPKRRRRIQRGDQPSFWTAASAIAGGIGGAAIGGWAARKGYDPRWVGAAIAGVGGLGAWKLDGNLRLASYGLAAAGAGGSLLEWLDKDEDKPQPKNENKDKPKDDKGAGKTDEPVAMLNGARQARSGGLDRAFNRVRERLHDIYEDDDDDAYVDDVEEEDAA